MSLRVRLFSDLHLEFEDFEPPPAECDVVVLAGDIHVSGQALPWIRRHFDVPVIYVLGNHEFYRNGTPLLYRLMDDWSSNNRSTGTVLENNSLRIGDTEFFGCTLWTDFNLFGDPVGCMRQAAEVMSDYALIRCGDELRPLQPADTVEFHQRSRDWLCEAVQRSDARRKVVVSHHAPSMHSLPPEMRDDPIAAAYASNAESLVESMGVDLWLHGHTHHAVDYCLGQTRVLSNPRGYIPFEPVAGFGAEGILTLD